MRVRGTRHILFSANERFAAGELRIAFVHRGDWLEICVNPRSRRPWRVRFRPDGVLFVDEESKERLEYTGGK